MKRFGLPKLSFSPRTTIEIELRKELDDTNEYSLVNLYNFRLYNMQLYFETLPIIGEGSEKIAYLYEDKVILRPKSPSYNIDDEVNKHINLLKEYIKYQKKNNNELLFDIPKIYFSMENKLCYIIDYISCIAGTHSKDFSKLQDPHHIYAYGQFIYLCSQILKLNPLDTEYCIDTRTNRLCLMDFGNYKKYNSSFNSSFNTFNINDFTHNFTESNIDMFNQGYDSLMAKESDMYKNKYLKYKNKYQELRSNF